MLTRDIIALTKLRRDAWRDVQFCEGLAMSGFHDPELAEFYAACVHRHGLLCDVLDDIRNYGTAESERAA